MRIYKREDSGKWGYDIHVDGKRKRSAKFKTKAEARAAAQELLSKGMDEERALKEDIMFVDFYKTWTSTHIDNAKMTKSSKQLYNNALNKFVDFLKERHQKEDIKIKDITRSMFQEFLNWYGENRTHESVRKIQNQMKRAFNDAEYDGIIERSPVYNTKINSTKDSQAKDDKFIKYDDFNQIRDYAVSRFEISYFIIYLLCITGARFSEIQRLQTIDLNREDNTLYLRGTKTDTSPRTVVLSAEDIDFILKRLNEYPGDTPLGISNNAVTKSLRSIVERFDLDKEHITLHMLRHTHCSVLINDGVDIHYVSKRLGHSSISTTLKTYSHLLDKKRSEEDEKVEQYLAQNWHKNKKNPDKR